MRKLFYMALAIIAGGLLFFSLSSKKPVADVIKKRLDTARMVTYWFQGSVCRVDYPSFFNVVSEDSDVVRFAFSFPNDDDTKIGLTCFIEPNTEGWNVTEAPDSLAPDEWVVFKYSGKDYYVLHVEIDGIRSFEKTYMIENKWYSYTLYYPKAFEKQVERLMRLVLSWHPAGVPQDENENEVIMGEWKHKVEQ